MDRLAAAQNLQTNQELISNNGWFRLKMFPNGHLAIYRTQANLTIWGGLMQADGNCEPKGFPKKLRDPF
jgi:hypothetical protein